MKTIAVKERIDDAVNKAVDTINTIHADYWKSIFNTFIEIKPQLLPGPVYKIWEKEMKQATRKAIKKWIKENKPEYKI